jgi:AAA15 family ATPase/GTPase
MAKWIQNISGSIPHTDKNVNIALDGRNLIVTGANGSGKTSFLRALYEKVDLLIAKKQGADLPQIKKNLSEWQKMLNQAQKGTTQYDMAANQVKIFESQIDAIEGGIQVDIPDNINLSSLYDDRKAVIRFFEEKRFAEITPATTAKGLSVEEESAKQQKSAQKFGNNLEQHLVNLMNVPSDNPNCFSSIIPSLKSAKGRKIMAVNTKIIDLYWRMRQFYESYKANEILLALLRELSWTNNLHNYE